MKYKKYKLNPSEKMKGCLKGVLVLVTGVFLLIEGCTKKPANYYRKIELDGRYSIVGRYPVPDKIANKVNCYHFIYDEKGKLIKVEYLKSGKLQNDPYFGVARIIIEYSEGYEKRIFQDAKGKPKANSDGVYSIRLKLDENNNPISLFNYDKEGNLTEDKYGVAQYLWTLDKKGWRIKSIRIDKDGERITDNNGYYELRWKYDGKGNIIERSNHGKDGQLLEGKDGVAITRMKYDENGNTIEERYFGTDEALFNNFV